MPFGDSVSVDNTLCLYENTRILYTHNTTGTGLTPNHGSVVIDDNTPFSSGIPEFNSVWSYMLGLCSSSTASISAIELTHVKINVYPNPTSDRVTVESSNTITKIEVINTLGVLLDSYEPNKKATQLNTKVYNGLVFLNEFTEENNSKLIKVAVN